MLKNITDILQILNNYITYIYPGLISIFIYKYLEGKKFKENNIIIIKSIAISYLYIVFLQKIIHLNLNIPKLTKIFPHIVLLSVSIILPIIFYKCVNAKWFEKIQKWLNISTRMSSNPIEIILSKEEKPWVCVYMDELGIMYEGYIRNYVKDVDRLTYLILSQYKISKFKENTNEYAQTYPIDSDGEPLNVSKADWIILYFEHITRIEIVYKNEH